jgi:hypothetical protein
VNFGFRFFAFFAEDLSDEVDGHGLDDAFLFAAAFLAGHSFSGSNKANAIFSRNS